MTSNSVGSSRNLNKNVSEMTVFERQQTQLKFLKEQHQSSANDSQYNTNHDNLQKIQASLQNQVLMLDHCLRWPEFGHITMPKEMLHSSSDCANMYAFDASSLTTALSTGVPCKKAPPEKEGDSSFVTPKSNLGNESLRKRKMDQFPQPKFDTDDKRIKRCLADDNSSFGTTISRVSADASRENSRMSEVTKPDYIHVRARRGQATDSHSLAERVRREKLSQKMRFLQDLVPGCDKITGKTGMLDEIIKYVQSLQCQVEFLSMKLATATTALDFNNGNIIFAEVLVEKAPIYPRTIKPDALSHVNFPSNQIQASTTLESVLKPYSTVQCSTINAPGLVQDNYPETASFTPLPTWDDDYQAIPGLEFHQGRSTNFPLLPIEGDATSVSNQFTMF
ncbi:unnamed protein product [Rhodiola kirilowii]